MSEDTTHVNEVRLVGRVSHVGEERELPSGDRVHAWRLVVARDEKSARNQPDVIDVSCWSAATRRSLARLVVGDTVEVDGALRRRFFRGASGVSSRYEVEARRVRKARG